MTQADTNILLIIAAIVLVVVALIWFTMRNRRTRALKDQFGPEYGRTVKEVGGVSRAEAELAGRTRRVEALKLTPLSPEDREDYSDSWRNVQEEFVDNPERSFAHADDLLTKVMGARGYPTTDFKRQSADLSVHHGAVVDHYHAAHDIALRNSDGEASTEDLRQGMVHYRALFDDLVNEPVDEKPAARPVATSQ